MSLLDDNQKVVKQCDLEIWKKEIDNIQQWCETYGIAFRNRHCCGFENFSNHYSAPSTFIESEYVSETAPFNGDPYKMMSIMSTYTQNNNECPGFVGYNILYKCKRTSHIIEPFSLCGIDIDDEGPYIYPLSPHYPILIKGLVYPIPNYIRFKIPDNYYNTYIKMVDCSSNVVIDNVMCIRVYSHKIDW
jgi:hypothetical protein